MAAKTASKRIFTPTDTLELFNEMAERVQLRLKESPDFKKPGALVTFDREGVGWESVHVGPDDRTLQAAVLTLRMFCQDNEPISLANMSRLYSTSPADCATQKQQFDQARAELNALLDSPTNISISEDGNLTHRQVFELFVYGNLAHAGLDPDKRSTYEACEEPRSSRFCRPILLRCSAGGPARWGGSGRSRPRPLRNCAAVRSRRRAATLSRQLWTRRHQADRRPVGSRPG